MAATADQGQVKGHSRLELSKHDTTVNAPERDHSAEAPERDHLAEASELDHQANAPKVSANMQKALSTDSIRDYLIRNCRTPTLMCALLLWKTTRRKNLSYGGLAGNLASIQRNHQKTRIVVYVSLALIMVITIRVGVGVGHRTKNVSTPGSTFPALPPSRYEGLQYCYRTDDEPWLAPTLV